MIRTLVLSIGLLGFLFSRGYADQVVVGGVSYAGTRVAGLSEGRLEFREADGELHHAWIDEIGMILVDRGQLFADFNEAERYLAEDEPQRALVRYRRALRFSEGFWSDLIEVRRFQASVGSGLIDQAADCFLRILRGRATGPIPAIRLIPRSYSGVDVERLQKAVAILDQAMVNLEVKDKMATVEQKTTASDPQAAVELFRYEMLRHLQDPRIDALVDEVVQLVLPDHPGVGRAFEIQMNALGKALSVDGNEDRGQETLDRVIDDVPSELLPQALILKGRTLQQRAQSCEDWIRASWPFLRVAIHMPVHALAADGLYGAALSLEKINRFDKAQELLEECLGHPKVGDQTRELATKALQRIRTVNH